MGDVLSAQIESNRSEHATVVEVMLRLNGSTGSTELGDELESVYQQLSHSTAVESQNINDLLLRVQKILLADNITNTQIVADLRAIIYGLCDRITMQKCM